MKLYLLFQFLIAVTQALPLFSTPTPSATLIETPTTQENQETTPQCPQTNFDIPVERFAQLVSTHWQFDHLESILTDTYRTISQQFQKHIQVSIKDSNDNSPSANDAKRQHSFKHLSSWEVMDFELLQAQIFGAIQAHTEGNLPLAWDKIADKLSRPALENFIKTNTMTHCQSNDTMEEQQLVSSQCLKEKAEIMSSQFDEYINVHLDDVITELDKNILPDLLARTSRDLSDVLNYFNNLFLRNNNQQLYLNVIPWEQQNVNGENTSLKTQLLPLLNKSILNDDHLVDFFLNYACLSRI
jgi:hypothetical protein